jgi:hypothetical protein
MKVLSLPGRMLDVVLTGPEGSYPWEETYSPTQGVTHLLLGKKELASSHARKTGVSSLGIRGCWAGDFWNFHQDFNINTTAIANSQDWAYLGAQSLAFIECSLCAETYPVSQGTKGQVCHRLKRNRGRGLSQAAAHLRLL